MVVQMDVVELREFYASLLGDTTCRLVTAALRPLIKFHTRQSVLGLGYAMPYLDQLVPADMKQFAFMLARQGVIHWPGQGVVQSALVDPYDLPLLESTVDHALVVHGLEQAEDPQDMLREIWRVLAPQGRLLLVVPNRRGLWSSSDASPFGYGQPFSRSQLSGLLKNTQFSVQSWHYALYMPPVQLSGMIKTARFVERLGAVAATRFSGVIIVEAMKQVYAFSSGKRVRRLVPRLKPVLLPAPQSYQKNADQKNSG